MKFFKKHNIKRVNIYWFLGGLVFSVIFSLISSLISNKWDNFISDALSLTALPSLFISCLVLTNIDDVRKQIKSEEASRDFFDRRKTQALSLFVRDYENNFKTNSKSLRDDLKKIILGESDFSDEFKKRVRKVSLECYQSLDSYNYVETRISIRKAQKTVIPEENTQRSLDIDLDILKNLKGSLKSCYSFEQEKFKDLEFCEQLSKNLNDFDSFCCFLIEESGGSETTLNDQVSSEESGTLEDTGDFYE